MPVQSTSAIAYHDIGVTLGKKQRIVIDVIAQYDDITNSELADHLGWPINTVTPRVFEVRELGVVEEAEKRICRKTGRLAIAWKMK